MEKRGEKAQASRKRKAQASIITTILIILLVIVAVVIVWNIVRVTILTKSSEIDVEIITVDNKFAKESINIYPNSKEVGVSVHRGTDNVELSATRIILQGEVDSYNYILDSSKYPTQGETIKYCLDTSEFTDNIISMIVYPISRTGRIGRLHEYEFTGDEDSLDSCVGEFVELGGCDTGSLKCPVDDVCNDWECNADTDSCESTYLNGVWEDGISCTKDVCSNGNFLSTPDDSICDNGLFCDGVETCDVVKDCQAGTLVGCDGKGNDGCCNPGQGCNYLNDDNCPQCNLAEDCGINSFVPFCNTGIFSGELWERWTTWSCMGGICSSTTSLDQFIVDCEIEDQCALNSCDASTDPDECKSVITTGANCDDGNACTGPDKCQIDGSCFGTTTCTLISDCATLSTSGIYKLGIDITASSSPCFDITGNGITLDCDNKKITTGSNTAVRIFGDNNIVKNCEFDGSGDLMVIDIDGDYNFVSDSVFRIDSPIMNIPTIMIRGNSEYNTIEGNNLISLNGGNVQGFGIYSESGTGSKYNDIIDNDIFYFRHGIHLLTGGNNIKENEISYSGWGGITYYSVNVLENNFVCYNVAYDLSIDDCTGLSGNTCDGYNCGVQCANTCP